MSKRSIEFENCNYSKKPKNNETSDYDGCSPLLFFDVYDSNRDNENNNVITEIFSDILNEKIIDTIANGFPHIQSCDKLVESYNETKIIQSINSDIVNCQTEKVNTKISDDFEMENINLEIVNNTGMEIVTSELVNNCVIGTVNSEIIKISDNGLTVEGIVTNATESNIDNIEVTSSKDAIITHVEYPTSHENEDRNRREEIGVLPMNLLLENRSYESVNMNFANDENMLIEGTSEVVLDSIENCTNDKQDLLILNNSDSLIENNILPTESIDKTKEVKIFRTKGKPEHESLKSDYKLRSSSTKLEISKVVTTPEKDKPLRRSSRTPKEKRSFILEDETPINKKGTPKISKTTSYEKILSKVEVINNEDNKTTTVKRRASSRIESLVKNEKVNHSPRKDSIVHSIQNTMPFDYNDPATWPQEIPDDMKVNIIKKGPVQIESIIFPRDEKNRCFSLINYLSKMPSGEMGRRFWLVYSKSQDAVYCFACRLFSYNSITTLANAGSKNWKKLNERLCAHESSPKHWNSMEQWGQFQIDNENTTCGLDLTYEQALTMIGQLKHFSSKKSNYTYCLAKQLETELESCGKKV